MRRIQVAAIGAAIVIGGALAVPIILFSARAPVLVVTDASFIMLHGASHLRRQQIAASAALFRPVKPVIIADGAGPDVVFLAITEAAETAWCVLFPRSQTAALRHFHEQMPEIPAVLMRGLARSAELPSPDGILCVYGTNREADLYRAGLCAGILGNVPRKPASAAGDEGESTTRMYVLWQDRSVTAAGRDLFSRGVRESDEESAVIFINSAAEMPDMAHIAGLALTSQGAEYLEKNPRMPVILFSWIDPAFTAREVAVQFDDSVWALAAAAVRMAVEQQAEGTIPSRLLIFSGKIADNSVSRALKKAAEKMP